jgi:hypothetical protein
MSQGTGPLRANLPPLREILWIQTCSASQTLLAD